MNEDNVVKLINTFKDYKLIQNESGIKIGYIVYKDDIIIKEFENFDEAFIHILKIQGQSFEYATKYGGYQVKVKETEK